MFDKLKAIKVRDRGDYPGLIITRPYVDTAYAELCMGDGEALICEAVSLSELEHVYIGDELAMPYDQYMTSRPTSEAMFEAVSSTKTQLIRTLRAFTRKLNSQLAGSGISAGVGDASTAEDDKDAPTAGGAEISPVRRVAGVPIVFARIPLSDGQSITIAFHSPTAQTAQLSGSDLLVAFRFLLNKRDVTHTVAPQGGVDVSLNQATLTLAKLAERNSPKFAKTQERARALSETINTKTAQLESINQEQNKLVEQGDSLAGDLAQQESDLSSTQKKLDKQRDINEKLRAELAKRQAELTPEPEPEPSPEPQPEPTPPPSGGTHPGTTRPAENDPPEATTDYATLFWYGCYQRPYGPGAVPDGVKVALTSQDARKAPIVAQKNADPSRYTYGVVGYEQPLSQKDIDHFSLFDFQNHLTIDEAKDQLQPLILLMRQFKGANPGKDVTDFINTYMKLNAPALEELPEQYREGNRANSVLITRLIQIYLGQSTGGIKALLDMIFQGINGIKPDDAPEKDNPPALPQLPDPATFNDVSEVALIDAAVKEALGALQESILDFQNGDAEAAGNMKNRADKLQSSLEADNTPADVITVVRGYLVEPTGQGQAAIEELTTRFNALSATERAWDARHLSLSNEPQPEPLPAGALTYPAPANIPDTKTLIPLLHSLTGTSSLLESSISGYGKSTIAKATEDMAQTVQRRIEAFRSEGVADDILTSLQGFLQLPQGRLKAPIIADLQKRKETVDALIPGYQARLDELKAILKADKPAREAAQRMIEQAKNGIEELIDMSFDDETEITVAQEQLKGWALLLREQGIDREDEIGMAQYNLDKTLKEFRGELTTEDTLGEIVDTLKGYGVTVSDTDENMLRTSPALVNDIYDEIKAARTAWENGRARYDTLNEAVAAWATAKLHGESRPNEITDKAQQFMEHLRREGVGLDPWVADMILKYPEALRWADLSYENAMNDLDSFNGDVKAALEAYIDGGVQANFKEPDTRTPEQIQEQELVSSLQHIVANSSKDLTEIREWRSVIREAHTFFTANNMLEAHDALVNQAINHIGDLMAQIARGVQ